MKSPLAWLLICVFGSLSPASATTYHFTVSRDGDGVAVGATTGRVWASGDRFRIQYDEQQLLGYDALVSAGRDDPTFALDSASKTYFDWWAFLFGTSKQPLQKSELVDLAIDLEKPAGQEEIAGWQAQRQDLRVSFTIETDYGSEVVKERVIAELLLWTTSEVAYPEPPEMVNPRNLWLEELFGLQTGADENAKPWGQTERKIADALAAIGGFPLKSRRKLTRQFKGGPPRVSILTIDFDHFEDTEVPASAFSLPEGYREHKPMVGAPGRKSGE